MVVSEQFPAILRAKDGARYIGTSLRHFYTLAETDPNFPRRIVFSARCVGWRRESLDAWLKAKEETA